MEKIILVPLVLLFACKPDCGDEIPKRGEFCFHEPITIEANGNPDDIEFADLDGDDDLDMVVSLRDSSELSIFTNPGDGNLHFSQSLDALNVNTSIALGDIDNDSDIDILSNAETVYPL